MPIKQECIAWASTNFGLWRIKNRLDKPLLGRTVGQEGQWDSSSLPKLCGALPAPCSLCAADFVQCLCTNHFFLLYGQILPSQLQRSKRPLPWRSRVSGQGALSKPVLLLKGNIPQPKTCSLRRFLAGSSHVLCTGNAALGISIQVRDTHGIFVGLFLTNPLMLKSS